jgi:hypothetical protein
MGGWTSNGNQTTTSDNVGIGPNAPATRLHVEGTSDQSATVAVRRSDNNRFVRLGVGSSGVTLEIDSSSFFTVSNNGGQGIGGILNGSELLHVTADGNVGIGTGTPAGRLHICAVPEDFAPVFESTFAQSKTLRVFSGPLGAFGTPAADLALASFSFSVDQQDAVSLGLQGIRTVQGSGWEATAVALCLSVNNKPYVGVPLVLAPKGIGIGVPYPTSDLHLRPGGILRIEGGTTPTDDGVYFSFGGNGVFAIDAPGSPQGRFVVQNSGDVGIGIASPTSRLHVAGDIAVTGDVLLTGADCAEHFDIAGSLLPEPGAVVVIDKDGALRESWTAYDKKVAGVVSGAGEYRHGLVLDKRSKEEGRIPVALVGKVYCKVDAQYSSIDVGDLLTTSPTPGHAMKATEPAMAFGAIIGKALKSLPAGTGVIPILVALQ